MYEVSLLNFFTNLLLILRSIHLSQVSSQYSNSLQSSLRTPTDIQGWPSNTNKQAYDSNQQPFDSNRQPYDSRHQVYDGFDHPFDSNNQPYDNRQPYGHRNSDDTRNPYGGQPGNYADTSHDDYSPMTGSQPPYPLGGGYGRKRSAQREHIDTLRTGDGGSLAYSDNTKYRGGENTNNNQNPMLVEVTNRQAVELKIDLRPAHFISPGVAKITCAAEVEGVPYQ